MKKWVLPAVAVLSIFAAGANAAIVRFDIELKGANERPGPGDPDGLGTGFIELDDVANTVRWSFVFADVDTAWTGAHIHRAAQCCAGPVVVNFSALNSGGPIVDADVDDIVLQPWLYYVNYHNSTYPPGALRGQVATPEPNSMALGAIGLAALWAGRRLRARKHR